MVNGLWITIGTAGIKHKYMIWKDRHCRKGMENGCGWLVTFGKRHGEWMGWRVTGGIHSIENGVWMDG
jgi:hypothetical protein